MSNNVHFNPKLNAHRLKYNYRKYDVNIRLRRLYFCIFFAISPNSQKCNQFDVFCFIVGVKMNFHESQQEWDSIQNLINMKKNRFFCCRFSSRFELPLLVQSIVMNLTMFLMIHLCVSVRRNNSILKGRERVFTGNYKACQSNSIFLIVYSISHQNK